MLLLLCWVVRRVAQICIKQLSFFISPVHLYHKQIDHQKIKDSFEMNYISIDWIERRVCFCLATYSAKTEQNHTLLSSCSEHLWRKINHQYDWTIEIGIWKFSDVQTITYCCVNSLELESFSVFFSRGRLFSMHISSIWRRKKIVIIFLNFTNTLLNLNYIKKIIMWNKTMAGRVFSAVMFNKFRSRNTSFTLQKNWFY